MPKYDYLCPGCHEAFEANAGVHERFLECVCGSQAERRPFSGIPNLKGATVARSIPDPAYRQEAEKRALNASWGDGARSVEMLRKNSFTDAQGNKQIDLKGMNNA